MRTMNRFITQVIACQNCKGAGEILIDPGEHSKVYEKITCPNCFGSGRLIRKVTIEHTPYNEDEKILVRI